MNTSYSINTPLHVINFVASQSNFAFSLLWTCYSEVQLITLVAVSLLRHCTPGMNICVQCISQYLETGCPKFAIQKFWGLLFFQGRPQYVQITTVSMYYLHEKGMFIYLYSVKGTITYCDQVNPLIGIQRGLEPWTLCLVASTLPLGHGGSLVIFKFWTNVSSILECPTPCND